MFRITAIYAAVSTDGIYGVGNSLPWPMLTKDMEMFRKATVGHIVIMGRTTFNSLPEKYKPLPHRINIVISNSMEAGGHFLYGNPEKPFYVFKSVEEALSFAKTFRDKNIFFIGGNNIWKDGIKYCNRAFITTVHTACRFQPVEKGPLNFANELLHPEMIFKTFGCKKHRLENSFDYDQEILDKNKKIIDVIRLTFSMYKLTTIHK